MWFVIRICIFRFLFVWKKIEHIGIENIKKFWYLSCELHYVTSKYSQKAKDKKTPNINDDKLKDSIYNFAEKFDSDYVYKNKKSKRKNWWIY